MFDYSCIGDDGPHDRPLRDGKAYNNGWTTLSRDH
jgi:hypothetical protein